MQIMSKRNLFDLYDELTGGQWAQVSVSVRHYWLGIGTVWVNRTYIDGKLRLTEFSWEWRKPSPRY